MTQWTQEQYEELSCKVAEKFGIKGTCTLEGYKIDGYVDDGIDNYEDAIYTLIHEHWATIMELCVEHGVWASHMPEPLLCVDYFAGSNREGEVYYTDHNNDKSLAERVARMLALLEVDNV